jgi:hypothetical protein
MDLVLVDGFDERVGIREVRIRVSSTKVRRWNTVLGTAAGKAKLLLEDIHSIRPGDTMQRIEENLEVLVGLEERLNQWEVKDILEHGGVVGGRINDFNLKGSIYFRSNCGDVYVRDICELV